MKIHYLDPALRRSGGHHVDWADRITRFLAEKHDVRVYASRRVKPDIRRQLKVEVVPHFHSNPYGVVRIASDPRQRPGLIPEDVLFLAAELRKLEPADLWLWPTLFARQLLAISLARPACPVSACLHWAPDQFTGEMPERAWRHACELGRRSGLGLNLGVTIAELQTPYSALLGRMPDVLPLLVEPAVDIAPRSGLKRIGFFGHQHRRKGVALIPELVQRLHGQGYEIVVQDSKGKVRAAATPGIRRLGFVDRLGDEIRHCDLVIAPYNPDDYKTMGSGIVWEAVAQGVPVIAPAATAPGRFIEETGAGLTFASPDADSICLAVARAADQYARLAQAARQAALAWPQHHGAGQFVTAMLAAVTDAR